MMSAAVDDELPTKPTACAICATTGNARELYPATFGAESLTGGFFSARRVPDGTHHRIVVCNICGLLRSDPVIDASVLADLYAESTFDYSGEVEAITLTYERYLAKLERLAPGRRGLLEIGCGNGFFLNRALARGWSDVRGVEPSSDAIAKASADVGPAIVCDMMRPGIFEPESFDVICLFQVLDHIPEPRAVLETARDLLRPGGHILALNHNAGSLSARLLRESSPIIDIEHTYLYDHSTMRRLFEQCGFRVSSITGVRNTYSLAYLAQLLPLPSSAKSSLLKRLRRSRVGKIRLTVPLGNLCLIAERPPAK
jgi:SAM-dependent methyltransferase